MKIIKTDIDVKFVRKWMDRGLNPIILSILSRRGIKSDLELYRFISDPSFGALPSPFLFDGIVNAYERLERAITSGEQILLFGDRDVDGITSIHIMAVFLEGLGAQFDWLLPVGNDPYGLNQNVVELSKSQYSLLITVDCGVTNIDEIAALKANGIDTIIIDHHQPHEETPLAIAIINPKYRYNDDFTDMAACVVSFLFAVGFHFWRSSAYNQIFQITTEHGLFFLKNLHLVTITGNTQVPVELEIDSQVTSALYTDKDIFQEEVIKTAKEQLLLSDPLIAKTMRDLIQHAALGTIADIMPMLSVNRSIVALGIAGMRQIPDERIGLLLQQSSLDHELVTANDIAWKITPLLNSPGRMGDARYAVRFLDHRCVADDLGEIVKMNDERKRLGEEAYQLFVSSIEDNAKLFKGGLNFFCSDRICRGVIGITANKLSEASGVPAIVCATDDEYVIGSMRGATSVHLVEFLDGAKELLDEYGGHHFAAGFRFKKENMEQFKEFLLVNSFVFGEKQKKDASCKIDAEIPLKYLNNDLYKALTIIEPFGEANPMPLFYTKGIGVDSFALIGKDKNHLKINFATEPVPFCGLFWDKGRWFMEQHRHGCRYDVVYTLELNVYKKHISVQMKIENMEMTK